MKIPRQVQLSCKTFPQGRRLVRHTKNHHLYGVKDTGGETLNPPSVPGKGLQFQSVHLTVELDDAVEHDDCLVTEVFHLSFYMEGQTQKVMRFLYREVQEGSVKKLKRHQHELKNPVVGILENPTTKKYYVEVFPLNYNPKFNQPGVKEFAWTSTGLNEAAEDIAQAFFALCV